MTTALDIAQWMLVQLNEQKYLYQEVIVYQIAQEFGEEFTCTNENGNMAINKKVRDEFRRITGDSVVWESGERMWRKREEYDSPGRRQD